MQVSSRHHYIPQFYTRGFTNDQGFLFNYDKQYDIIQKNSPKGIFFEKDRNTINLNEETSILEEIWYKKIDDKCSEVVRKLRENTNEDGILNSDNLADIQFFILCLFWRVPKTDFAFDRYFRESEIFFTDKDSEEANDKIEEKKLKKDWSKKFARASIVINALRNNYKKEGYVCSQLFDKGENLFLLGDYPIVFKKTPATFDDLFQTDYFLPISSKRLFCSFQNERELTFDFNQIIKFNSLVIDQSVRYVCCSDLEHLQRSIACYKEVKEKHLMSLIRDSLFKTKLD